MTDDPRQDEREALIVGDRVDPLSTHEADELALLADLLADPSTWAEPAPGLEDAVVRAVVEAEPAPRAASRRRVTTRRRRIMASVVAAAAAIAITVGVVATTKHEPHSAFAAQLASTELSPGAHATAEVYRTDAGFHINLDARGLPTLPAGQYYQAWLKNEFGELVPIGTFSSSGRVTLWSGVSPRDFSTMSVTLEVVDGNPGSSGQRVLLGSVVPN